MVKTIKPLIKIHAPFVGPNGTNGADEELLMSVKLVILESWFIYHIKTTNYSILQVYIVGGKNY